jgi:hypothetical protein
MTRYAVDEVRQALVGSWSTGPGDVAVTVADLPPSVEAEDALRVADLATRLSEALWRRYTHPVDAADGQEPDTENWKRQDSPDAFSTVADAIRSPHLPHDGLLIREYDPVAEYAHGLGRALHAIGDQLLADRVVADVQAELDAVGQADLGDLSGRARQAVALTRGDASPVQVAAADRLLHENPLNGRRLFTDVDPVAAAVAAAHWLWAAAVVAAGRSDIDIAQVVRAAADIEALPWQSPTLVLSQLADGEPPRSVVTGLVSEAMMVAEGKIPDLIGLLALAGEAEAKSGGDLELCQALISSIRATPLDPARPALDLLEDLLSGIRGCWLIFTEYASVLTADDEEDNDLPDGSGIDNDALTEEYISLVRAAAAEEHDQLI